jgi:cardiolipin synthase
MTREQLPFLVPLTWALTVIGFLLALLLLAHLLGSRRPPSSTIAWLLIIVLAPYIGVPLYLMIGGRKLRRMAGRKEMVYNRAGSSVDGLSGRGTERILRSFGVPQATTSNRVQLVTDGQDAYHQLVAMIDGARRSIHLTTYILGRDAVGKAVVERLARRATEGVKVRVLIDDLGSWRTPRRFLTPIVKAGGEVAYFMPVLHWPFRGRSNLRNHRKVLVTDSIIALTGGMNVASEYLGPNPDPERWRDVSAIVEGPAAGDLESVFWSDWSFATGQPVPTADVADLSPTPAGAPVQVVASGPDVEGDPLYESLVAALFAARERIWVVTPYFVPDEVLVHALDLAARRGVDVRLVIPLHSNHLSADLARVGYLRQVSEAGCRILRYKPVMIHAKVIVVDDDLAVVGSANMDMRSLFLNYEVALFLYGPEQVRDLAAWIATLFPSCRPGINPTNWGVNLVENIVRLLSPLL